MQKVDLNLVFEQIAERRDSLLAGPQSEADIAWAEERLDLNFPADFRAFLGKFGGGGFAGEDIYGVAARQVDPLTVVGVNEDARKNYGLAPEALIFSTNGGGLYYYLYLPEGSDPCVRAWEMGAEHDFAEGYVITDSFAALLAEYLEDAPDDGGFDGD